MSTRAIYTVIAPKEPMVHIYIHHDGYPRGAAEHIANALPYAWKLPRFEPDEFAAALCAGNKGYYLKRELEQLRKAYDQALSEAQLSSELREEIEYSRKMAKDYSGGGVRVFKSVPLNKLHMLASDIEYRYEIRCVDKQLQITCFETNYWQAAQTERKAFEGTLSEFTAWVQEKETV